MRWTRMIAAVALASGVCMATPAGKPAELAVASAPATTRPSAGEVVAAFVESVSTSDAYPESARRFVVEQWEARRTDGRMETLLAESLSVLYPDFKAAMDDYDGEHRARSAAGLSRLAEHADPWLAVNAAILAAQALLDDDRGLEADRLLQAMTARHADWQSRTTAGAEGLFLAGYCALQALRYDEARERLEAFTREYPDAPERLRGSARQMLLELSRREPERLGDVHDLMRFASRELSHGRTDDPVREHQQKAVELLAKLIDEAEQREKQQSQQSGGSKGGRSRGGSNRPGQPGGQHAQRSTLPPGEGGDIGELREQRRVRPGEAWGKMPPQEREALLQSLQKQFPSQYRDLVEQYYRQLSKENGEP